MAILQVTKTLRAGGKHATATPTGGAVPAGCGPASIPNGPPAWLERRGRLGHLRGRVGREPWMRLRSPLHPQSWAGLLCDDLEQHHTDITLQHVQSHANRLDMQSHTVTHARRCHMVPIILQHTTPIALLGVSPVPTSTKDMGDPCCVRPSRGRAQKVSRRSAYTAEGPQHQCAVVANAARFDGILTSAQADARLHLGIGNGQSLIQAPVISAAPCCTDRGSTGPGNTGDRHAAHYDWPGQEMPPVTGKPQRNERTGKLLRSICFQPRTLQSMHLATKSNSKAVASRTLETQAEGPALFRLEAPRRHDGTLPQVQAEEQHPRTSRDAQAWEGAHAAGSHRKHCALSLCQVGLL